MQNFTFNNNIIKQRFLFKYINRHFHRINYIITSIVLMILIGLSLYYIYYYGLSLFIIIIISILSLLLFFSLSLLIINLTVFYNIYNEYKQYIHDSIYKTNPIIIN